MEDLTTSIEHLVISVDNLVKKIDTLQDEILQYRKSASEDRRTMIGLIELLSKHILAEDHIKEGAKWLSVAWLHPTFLCKSFLSLSDLNAYMMSSFSIENMRIEKHDFPGKSWRVLREKIVLLNSHVLGIHNTLIKLQINLTNFPLNSYWFTIDC